MPSRSVQILATGAHLPPVADAAALAARAGLSAAALEALAGVRRRHAVTTETATDLGVGAARAALDAAGLDAADLDLVLGACGSRAQPLPGPAVLVHRGLGLGASGVPAFDVDSTCLSFVSALDVAALWIAAGRARRVLVVSAEVASAAVDWRHPESAALFGDGAAAAVLGPSDGEAAILAARHETFSHAADWCRVRGGGTALPPGAPGATDADFLFEMDGPRLFRLAAHALPAFAERLAAEAGLALADLDLVVPHQASASTLRLLGRRLGVADRLVSIVETHGNCVAASIPLALDHAVRTGRLRRGDTAMLIGTSAGVSLGGLVLRY